MKAHGGVISVSASDGLVIRITWPRGLKAGCSHGGPGSQSLPGVSASP
jgi:hypothetical protein